MLGADAFAPPRSQRQRPTRDAGWDDLLFADHSGFDGDKRVYEDECGLNECIGLFSSFHNTYLDDLIVE